MATIHIAPNGIDYRTVATRRQIHIPTRKTTRQLDAPFRNGVMNGRFVIGDDNQRWFRKAVPVPELFAETIASKIGPILGINVPDTAISPRGVRQPNNKNYSAHGTQHWYLYSKALDNSETFEHSTYKNVVHRRTVADKMCFDAFMINPDGHTGNCMVQELPDGQVKLWAIDYGRSLIARSFNSSLRKYREGYGWPAVGTMLFQQAYEELAERVVKNRDALLAIAEQTYQGLSSRTHKPDEDDGRGSMRERYRKIVESINEYSNL